MKNTFTTDGDTTTVHLKNGEVALIDTADLPILEAHKGWWGTSSNGDQAHIYSVTGTKVDGKWTSVRMHREIMQPPPGALVDHINHNTLDNRRSNLRIATHSENLQNQGVLRKDNSTGYRGVYFVKLVQKWQAYCRVDGKRYTFGNHSTPEAANEAAIAGRQKHLPFATS